ncbi:hypothetical protein CTI12_AA251470 [Artemisia annua]|uniref:Ulp1 protease family, C-terminal catalytic domain-containing protein n=1 Tax=Artemisia annua TaxID=35608 RepID=A0A2U1NLA8_ARTAN|nr:hypothetical protein CTI12_AA251470 [Artemisia annua]
MSLFIRKDTHEVSDSVANVESEKLVNMEIPTVDSTRNAVEDVTPSNVFDITDTVAHEEDGFVDLQLEDRVVDTNDSVAKHVSFDSEERVDTENDEHVDSEGVSLDDNVTMKNNLSKNDGFVCSPKNEEKTDEGVGKEVNDKFQENDGFVGEELLHNVRMKEDLSADSGNDGCLEIQKNKDSDTIFCIPDEVSDTVTNVESEKLVNMHIPTVDSTKNAVEDVTPSNVVDTTDTVAHEDILLVSKNVSIDSVERVDTENDEDVDSEGASLDGNVTIKDNLSAAFQNDGFFGSPKNEDKTDKGVDKEVNDKLQENDGFVGEELVQNVTLKEDLFADSGNDGCLEIQNNPDEVSEKEINDHLNVNSDIIKVQPTNDSLKINTEIDVKTSTAAEEHELLTQDGLDFQNKFVEYPESTEGESNEQIFTDDSKKGNDSELLFTTGLQKDIETEYTSITQMGKLDVENVGSLKINDFEECDSISEFQEQTYDSSHSLQMDNSNPISQNVSLHSLATKFSDMQIDEVRSASQDDFSTSLMVGEEILQNLTMKEDLTADSRNGGCLEFQKNEDSDNISCIPEEASEKEINEHVIVNTDIVNVQATDDYSNINTETDEKSRAVAEEHDLRIQDDLVVQKDYQNEVSAGDFQRNFVELLESAAEFSVTAELERDIQKEDTSDIQMETLDVQNVEDFESISEIQEATIESSHSHLMDNSNPISKKLPQLNENVFVMNENVKTIDSAHSLAMESSASASAEIMCHTSMSACEDINLDKGILMNDESSIEDISHLNALEKNSEFFNIRNGYAVILDNVKSDAPYHGKYKKVFEFVKSLLVDFLARNKFSNKNLFLRQNGAEVLNLRWKTRNDKINCGLYAMIHMEHYEFEDEEWEIGILDEEDPRHRIQMDVLRNRYITKIFLHEINQHTIKMIHSAENWISKNPDEFEEEGTEAELRRITKEDCLKYNLSPVEIQEEQKFESFKSKLLLEINKMGDFLKGCKYRRNFGHKKIVGVDCVEVDGYPKSYSVTLDDNSKHKLSSSQLKIFGYQEWNEFMLCIFHGSLNDKLKKKIMMLVLKLLTMAKMMNEISADEAYQSYIGLTPFKNPTKQWFFVQICKEVLVGDANMPDGIVFEHLKYYKEPVEGVCFLKDDRKQCFQTYSGVTNLPLLHMVIFYKLCITEQNAPFRERVLRALHFQKNALSKHPEFYDVWEVATKYSIKDSEVNNFKE